MKSETRTASEEWLGFVLSKKPHMTVGLLRSLIDSSDEASRFRIADFIGHRLEGRYIQPHLNVKKGFRSGFSMMASACLLIETMQSFFEGADKTPAKWGSRYFAHFFEREKKFFPKVEVEKGDFYTHIRCGILHQAEVTAGYRILRRGPLFDISGRAYNAETFLSALRKCVEHYVSELKSSDPNAGVWKCAVNKLEFVCLNCKRPPRNS